MPRRPRVSLTADIEPGQLEAVADVVSVPKMRSSSVYEELASGGGVLLDKVRVEAPLYVVD